jgi:hypothetical protein
MGKNIKKRLIIAVLVVAVLCAVCIGVYFAYPRIKDAVNPSAKAIEAMKNAGNEMSAGFESYIDGCVGSKTNGSVRGYSGSVTYDTLTVNSNNLLDLVKTNTISYNYGVSLKDNQTGGVIGISDGADEPEVVKLYFLIDSNTLYFKVPQLSAYNFKLSTADASSYADKAIEEYPDIDLDFDSNDIAYLIKLFKTEDAEESESYGRMVKSFMADLKVGYEKAVEEFSYTKIENSSKSYENADCYSVTVTKDAMIDGADAAIEAIYDDDTIYSYRTLISSYYKNSREKLKEAVRSRLEDFESFNMIIYVDSANARVIALETNANGSTTVIESTEANAVTHVSRNIFDNGRNIVTTSDRLDADTYSFSSKVFSDETNISVSGEAGNSNLNKLSVSASDFTNALDITQLTVSQYQAVMAQIADNYGVLSQIISEESLENLGQ